MADFDSVMAQYTQQPAPVTATKPDSEWGSFGTEEAYRAYHNNMEQAARKAEAVDRENGILDTKKVNVVTAAEQKKTAMGGGILPSFDQAYQTSVGANTGQGLNSMSGVEHDIRTLRPIQLRAKYGDKQAAALMGQANLANQAVLQDGSATRSDGQAVRDSVVDVGSGFVMPALNIGAFGLGLVNQDAGVSAAQGLAKLNNWTQNTLQSDELNQRRKVNEARNALDSRDSKAQQEIDLSKGDSELYVGLKRLGRGAINAVSNAADDSAILGSGIANGVGTLLSGSGAANVLKKVAEKAIPLFGASLNASKAAAAIESAAFPLTIGAMEGAGVYQQTADAIAKMPFEELAKNSPDFNELVKVMSPEEARIELANKAGLRAGAITAPVAAIMGKLVAPFEANPFARASGKTVVQNGFKEFLEEAGQSGWGAGAQNEATKRYANSKQDLLDNVGEQAGEGGLYGMGTTAAIAGPSAIKNAVSDSSKYLWGEASTAMNESAANLEASNEAASPLAPNKVAAEVEATQAAMPETAAAIQAGIYTSSLNQEEKTQGQAYAATLTNSLVYGEAESAHLANHPIGAVVAGSKDKAEAMLKLAKFVNENGDAEQGTTAFDAAQELNNYVFDLEEALRSEPASLSKLPDDHPAVVQMSSIKDTLAKVNAQPIVKKALGKIDAMVVAFNASNAAAQITPESLATPEGQQFAQTAANVIAYDPAKANPALVNAVLAHAASGKLTLTPKQEAGVKVAKTLFDAASSDYENRVRLGLKKQDEVKNQIQAGIAASKIPGQLSALEHATDIYNLYRANRLADATDALNEFRKFAQGIHNKLAALNQHLATGKGDPKLAVEYDTIDPKTRKATKGKSWVKPWNDASVSLMQDVAADAKMLTEVYNNLRQTFPELQSQDLSEVTMDSRIDKPAAEVVAAFKTGVKSAAAVAPKVEPENKASAAIEAAVSPSLVPVVEAATTADVSKNDGKVNTSVESVQKKAKTEQVTLEAMAAKRKEQTEFRRLAQEAKLEAELATVKGKFVIKQEPKKEGKTIDSSAMGAAKVSGNALVAELKNIQVEWETTSMSMDPNSRTNAEVMLMSKEAKIVKALLAVIERMLTRMAAFGTEYVSELQQRLADLKEEALLNEDGGIESDSLIGLYSAVTKYAKEYAAVQSNLFTENNPSTPVPQAPQGSVAPVVTPAVEPKKKAEPPATSTPTVAEPSTPAVVPSLVQEEEADPIEEEDDSDVTPFVYTGEATGLRDETKFSKLFGGTANRFLDAYKKPTEPTSRIALVDAAIETISETVATAESMEDAMGKAPKPGFSSLAANIYTQYVAKVGAATLTKLNENLTAWLNKKSTSKKTGITSSRLQQVLAPGFVNNWENGKILNVLQNDNGKLNYDGKLVEGAVLAGLQWLITSEGVSGRMNTKRVASALGVFESQVPAGLPAVLSIGQGELEATRSLGRKIKEYWGLEGNKDYPMNVVDGIPDSLAAEVLRSFEEMGLIKFHAFWFDDQLNQIENDSRNARLQPTGATKMHHRVEVKLADSLGKPENFKALQSYPDAIEQAVMVKPEQTVYLEDERPDVARTQMRNPGAKNKKQALKAIEVNQDTAYKFTHQYKLYEALAAKGYDKLMQLFGFGALTPDDKKNKFNKNHLVAVEGKNQSIVSAINGMNYLDAQVKARAEAVGKAPEEIGVHFPHAPSKVQRLQQIGRVTPQGDKNMRAALSPHEAVLDLDDTRRNDYKSFLIAIAQAVGIKVHNIKPEIVHKQIQELLHNELKPAVNVLQDWAKNMDRPIQDDAADIFLQSFKDAGMDFSNLALQSLTEYALYLNAERGKGRTAFKTTLYGEADGMTNGPGGAMILHSTGPFTVHQLQMMRKVGYYPGQKDWTAQDQFAEDNVDTYGTVAQLLNTSLPTLRDTYAATSTPAANQVTHMLNMLDLLFEGNLSYDTSTDVLTIKRGAAKSPVTVTIYGAGQQGIASKIAGIIADELYEKMSAVAAATYADPTKDGQSVLFGSVEKYNKFMAAFDALTNNYVGINKKGEYYLGKSPSNTARDVSSWHQYAVDFTITPKEMENLTGNIKRIFVEPMDTAIRQTMGESLMSSMELIRQATQVQTIFLEDAFQSEVKRALAKKEEEDPNFQVGDFLSENELKKILDKLKYMMPKIDNGTQEYYLAGNSSAEVGDVKPFGMSLNEHFKTPAMVYGPKDLGVGGIAALNIGMVDGQMIMNFYWDSEVVGTMPVFDGIDISLDKLGEYSEKANKAIFDAWMGNAMKALSESYGVFMQDTDITAYLRSPQLKDKLAKAFYGQRAKGEDTDSQDIAKELASVNRKLKVASVDVEIRHLAMQDIGAGIDQMASFSSPHWHEGTISVEGMPDEQIIEVLNERKAFHRSSVIKDQIKSENIKDAIFGKEQVQPVEIFTAADLPFLGSKMNIPADQKWMLDELVNNAALDGWTFIAGTKEKIREEAFKYGALTEHLDNLEKGLTLPSQKLILLPTNSSETLVHEMLHAATWNVIYLHYTDMLDGHQSVYAAEAIAKLEELMTQFMNLGENLPALSIETTQQYLHVRSVIQGHLNSIPTDGALAKAAALNEFMAYTQTNQALIRLTKNTEINPITPIWKLVVQFMKKLLWGNKAPKIGNDMFSNVLFSTSVLVRYQINPAKLMAAASTAVLPHSSPKSNLRLQAIRDNFLKRIPNHLKTPLTKDGVLTGKVTSKAIQIATEAAMTLNAHGFPMEPIEQSTFTSIVQTLATQAVIDPNTMARAQELFTLATKALDITHFIDPTNPDKESAKHYANEQYDAVMGNYYEGKDALGRSTLLPVFMALAITNEKFRGVLSKLELPKTKLKDWDSLDSAFENAGNSLMDKLSLRLSGEGKHAPNVQAAIDALTEHLMSTANDDLLTRMTEGFADWRETRLNKRNSRLLGYIDKSAKALHRASVSALKNPQYGKFSQTLGKLGELTSAIINEDNAEIVAQGIVSTINKVDGFRTLREVIADIVGRTDSNAEIYDQNKLVRTMVSQDRQHYRDDLPGVILEQFSRTVTKEEMTAMFHGLGKTDIALLRESMKDAEIRELFTKPSALPMAIRTVETQLKTADPQHWNQVEKKAKQLADYMNGKGYGNNLLRNAESVANLFDEPQQTKRTKPGEAYIKAVDKLVSLYAIDGLNNENRSNLSSLVQSEAKGVDFVMAYLTGQRAEEVRKANASLTARMNYFKGFVPSSQDGNVTMVVSSDAEYSKLIGKSYTKVESYKGSSLVGGEPRSYYFANVPGRAAYNQGTMQNARQTAGGIDLATGFTDGLMTAGRITDRKLVYRLTQNLRNERATTEPLLPVRSVDGVIVAFERAVDPKQLERLKQSTDLAKMIGVWRGRQVEEAKVQVFNEALVDAAKKMYKTDLQNSSSKKAEYINVFDPKEQKKDPVLADAVRLLNPETLKYIEDVFGKDTFMVRKELANDMLGYRGATVGDFWTGNHRWSPETENIVKNLATSVFGNKAYQYMVNGERILQNVVGSAKTLIVMKSIIVPIANLIGNAYQLISRGVPLLSIGKGFPRKTLEVDAYSKSRRREVKVEALLRAAEGNVMNTYKLNAELQSIRDSYRRMSIWPLIEAGQFSSISDMEVANEDVQLTSGKLHEYIESLVDKLPTSIRNAGRYALVTKDTALFQGLQKAVNYGDFIAKAVLYDDLTQRKGLTSKEALARITEEFVNYDRLPGRNRGYLESVGMLWFYNFKLRLVKIALSTIRNNPVHALVVGMMPKPDLFGSIGTPITDNLFSKAWSGSLGNSIGPGMLFNAPMLLPTVNAVFD